MADPPLDRFWEHIPMADMSAEQWESLCDRCGRCCLHRLEDDDGTIIETRVACKLLNIKTCRCSDYRRRFDRVPDCASLRLQPIGTFWWLPETCAYRRLDKNLPLEDWHPLISGDPDSVHRAGISIRGRAISERDIDLDDLEHFLMDEGDPDP